MTQTAAPTGTDHAQTESAAGASLDRLRAEHTALASRGLRLNIARGKPSPAQLDLSNALLGALDPADCKTAAGDDVRNYGGDPRGLAELRAVFGPLMGAKPEQVVAGGNSSLAMMHDCLVWALLKGVPGSREPWSAVPRPAFLCPAPGYEKHHLMCEEFGIELLAVPVTPDGPDMDTVERLVADPRVKGMWCVPTYANPTGETYGARTVRRLADMAAGASDFRIFWDDAYVVHHLRGHAASKAEIIDLCAAAGNPDRPFVFASTSKITFGGGGVGFFAGSPRNVEWYLARDSRRGVGPDKINQLRHACFLRDVDNLGSHMDAHGALLAPKFDAVQSALQGRLHGHNVATWSVPRGGYFVSIETKPGIARRAVELAQEAGVTLTVAGSTWPYGRDPNDSNIRIAPSFATLEEVEAAAEVIALSILLAAAEQARGAGGA